MTDRPAHILPTIVFAQFAGTSLWFAGNAVLEDAQRHWGIPQSALGWLVSSVQLGFIVGTLLFAVFNIADRVPSRAVFLICALCAAAANAAKKKSGKKKAGKKKKSSKKKTAPPKPTATAPAAAPQPTPKPRPAPPAAPPKVPSDLKSPF